MKRIIASILLIVVLGCGCSFNIQEPEQCSLCDAFPRHAPCIVDLNTGELRELEIYQPHHTKVAELAEEQRGGYLSFIKIGDIRGICYGAERIELKAPKTLKGIEEQFFCNDCRQLLKGNKCEGYILADLRYPETPTVWRIEEGASFSVRCYDIQISAGEDTDTLSIFMTGILDLLKK